MLALFFQFNPPRETMRNFCEIKYNFGHNGGIYLALGGAYVGVGLKGHSWSFLTLLVGTVLLEKSWKHYLDESINETTRSCFGKITSTKNDFWNQC